MEAKQTSKPDSGNELPAEQAGEVAGGTATASVGSCGVRITNVAPTPGEALIGLYDGAVEATTHVIETVSNATK